MIYDLAVIGTGFWGRACAVMAREKGLSVITFSDGNPLAGSINAAGITKKSWYRGKFFKKKVQPAWWSTKWLDFGVDWLGTHAGLVRTGEDVKRLYGKDRLTRTNGDCWVLPDVMGWLKDSFACIGVVSSVQRLCGAWDISVVGSKIWSAKKVVIAAGHATDQLLAASSLPLVGVSRLEGRAVLTPGRLERPLRVLRTAYDHVTFRNWPGELVRFGDTVGAKDPPVWWHEHGPKGSDLATLVRGFRPVCERAVVELVAPDLVVATGGHRVGMAMSPAAASRALKLLGVM